MRRQIDNLLTGVRSSKPLTVYSCKDVCCFFNIKSVPSNETKNIWGIIWKDFVALSPLHERRIENWLLSRFDRLTMF